MPHAAYPDAAAVQNLLKGAGVLPDASPAHTLIPWDTLIAAAVDRLHHVSGYRPFLSGAVATERTVHVDGPKRLVDLGGGVVPGTATGVSWRPPFPGAGDAHPLTEGEDYRWEATDAPGEGRPYDFLRFLAPRSGDILITARWGFGTAVPDDVYQAVLYEAAGNAYPVAMSAIETAGGESELSELRPVASVRYGDEQRQHNAGVAGVTGIPTGSRRTGVPLADAWLRVAAATMKRYRRTVAY